MKKIRQILIGLFNMVYNIFLRYSQAVLLVIVVILLFISAACSVAGSYLIKPLINDYILPLSLIHI